MEIDVTSIVIGVGILILFMLPIFFYQLSVSRKDRRLTQLLKEISSKHQASIDEKENFRTGFALGIDKKKNLLFWVHADPETKKTESAVYSLSEFDTCSTYRTQSGSGSQDGSTQYEIGINLKTGNNKNSVNIPTCSVRQGWLAGDENAQADRWQKKVQLQLKSPGKTG